MVGLMQIMLLLWPTFGYWLRVAGLDFAEFIERIELVTP